MKKVYSVEEYIEVNAHFAEALNVLRDIINTTELEETIKWSAPVYALNGKNIIAIGAFKKHFCIWFFNGIFLKDTHSILVNAQENKTKALRQMRFDSIDAIDKNSVLAYIKEALENQKLGKEIKPDRSKKEIIVPMELKVVLDNSTDLKLAFENLSHSKQREYCEHIASAKRENTKLSRLEKIKPMILQKLGLNDKYKNC